MYIHMLYLITSRISVSGRGLYEGRNRLPTDAKANYYVFLVEGEAGSLCKKVKLGEQVRNTNES
jgi:hypothetical protein